MKPIQRPAGITALALFFGLGAAISLLSLISLSNPGGVLEPIWSINPRARPAFAAMGRGAFLLLGAVCLLCFCSALGLWNGRRWGYWLAVGLLVIDICGNLANVALRSEPRAAIGVPIAAAILLFLRSRRPRAFFGFLSKEETAAESG